MLAGGPIRPGDPSLQANLYQIITNPIHSQ